MEDDWAVSEKRRVDAALDARAGGAKALTVVADKTVVMKTVAVLIRTILRFLETSTIDSSGAALAAETKFAKKKKNQ